MPLRQRLQPELTYEVDYVLLSYIFHVYFGTILDEQANASAVGVHS